MKPSKTVIDVKALRARLKLSQAQFSRVYGISSKTLRNWEQGIREPRGAARILIALIDKDPTTIANILTDIAKDHGVERYGDIVWMETEED